MKKHLPVSILLTALTLCAFSAQAADRETALGNHGELYRVHTGTYADLFPGDKSVPADNAVLALDIRRQGETQRLLVPGTEGEEVEKVPFLVFEDTSASLFLVWESRSEFLHGSLRLASLQEDGSWHHLVDITGNRHSITKGLPQLAVTRDTYQLDQEEGEALTIQRMILHLLWWENTAEGKVTRYAPIALLNGSYQGPTPILTLNDYDPAELYYDPALADSTLFESPKLTAGRDGRSVTVAFSNPATSRLVSFELRVLPVELGQLADKARGHLVDIGHRFQTGGQLEALAEAARGHLVDIGQRFEYSFITYLAQEVAQFILDEGSLEDLESLGDEIQRQTLEIGARLAGSGLTRSAEKARGHLVDIGVDWTLKSQTQFFSLHPVQDLPLPQTAQQVTSLLLSKDGQHVIVFWQEGNRLRYLENEAADWSDVREIEIDPEGLTLQQAQEILQQRLRDR